MQEIKLEATFKKMSDEGWCDGCNGDYLSCKIKGICQAYQDYHDSIYKEVKGEKTD